MISTKMIREIPVKLPSHRVWDKLADIGNICHGHSAVTKSFITSDLKTGVGATRHCDFTMMGASARGAIRIGHHRTAKKRGLSRRGRQLPQ